MPHGIGHLPSTIIKQGKEKAKKEAANKKKVAANAKKVEANKKKVAENKAKVRLNKADVELAKFYKKIPKSQSYLKPGGPVKKAQTVSHKTYTEEVPGSKYNTKNVHTWNPNTNQYDVKIVSERPETPRAQKPKTTMKKGGATGDKNWIQKAVNPKHKGYCTPMTKPTCTPKRKALAKTFKAMAKKR